MINSPFGNAPLDAEELFLEEQDSLTDNQDPVDSLNWKYSALQDAEYSDTVSVLQHEPTFFKHQAPYLEEALSRGCL